MNNFLRTRFYSFFFFYLPHHLNESKPDRGTWFSWTNPFRFQVVFRQNFSSWMRTTLYGCKTQNLFQNPPGCGLRQSQLWRTFLNRQIEILPWTSVTFNISVTFVYGWQNFQLNSDFKRQILKLLDGKLFYGVVFSGLNGGFISPYALFCVLFLKNIQKVWATFCLRKENAITFRIIAKSVLRFFW